MAASTSSQVQFGDLEQLVDRLKSTVQQAFESSKPVDQLEQDLFAQLMSLGHALLGSWFAAMNEGDASPTVEKNGKTLRRLPQKFHRTYYSIFGKFDINRCAMALAWGKRSRLYPVTSIWDCLTIHFHCCLSRGWASSQRASLIKWRETSWNKSCASKSIWIARNVLRSDWEKSERPFLY